MVKLTVINSNSSGNGYILQCEGKTLLLEAGVPAKEMLKALNFDLSNISACFLSHSHSDHAKYVSQYARYGIKCYSTKDCAEKHQCVMWALERCRLKVGGFVVFPMLVPHSVDCYAYAIDCPDKTRILFYTDCNNFPYKITGVNVILGEVNYCDSRIIENLGGTGVSSRPEAHMGLETAVEVIRRHHSGLLNNIVCLHLSANNSDENEIKQRIKDEVGIEPAIALPHTVIELNKEEF